MRKGTLTIDLPKVKLEKLEKLAQSSNCTVESLARNALLMLVDGTAERHKSNDVLRAIEDLQQCIVGRTEALGRLLASIFEASVVSRYSASKGLEVSDELLSLELEGRLLNSSERRKLQKLRMAESEDMLTEVMSIAIGAKKPRRRKKTIRPD